MVLKNGTAAGIALALTLLLAYGCREQKLASTPVAADIGTSTPAPSPTATRAQPSLARLEFTPTSAAPGESITLRGSGWPAGVSLVANLYETSGIGGPPGAPLGTTFQTDANGTFSVQGTVPRTLFGAGSRGNLNVIPGDYTIVVSQSPEVHVTAQFVVGAPSHGALLWGEAFFDINGNGQQDAGDIPWTVDVSIQGSAPSSPTAHAITDGRGRYVVSPLKPGLYRLSTQAEYQSATWTANTSALAENGRVTWADLLLRLSSK